MLESNTASISGQADALVVSAILNESNRKQSLKMTSQMGSNTFDCSQVRRNIKNYGIVTEDVGLNDYISKVLGEHGMDSSLRKVNSSKRNAKVNPRTVDQTLDMSEEDEPSYYVMDRTIDDIPETDKSFDLKRRLSLGSVNLKKKASLSKLDMNKLMYLESPKV